MRAGRPGGVRPCAVRPAGHGACQRPPTSITQRPSQHGGPSFRRKKELLMELASPTQSRAALHHRAGRFLQKIGKDFQFYKVKTFVFTERSGILRLPLT